MEDPEKGGVSWYPHPPPSSSAEATNTLIVIPPLPPPVFPPPHPIWSTSSLKYTSSNVWPPSIRKETKEKIRRHAIAGVEVRDLPTGHFLHGTGQQGLFAVAKFEKFDILGEYTGRIVGDEVNGHYVAALEDKAHSESLGVDGEVYGNELRFINSYLNIDFFANVTMRTAYVNTLPHILIVCMRDIEIGEEFLLDYGDAYNKAYLIPKEKAPETPRISMAELAGFDEDSDD